jgi:ElaB/YqjD/DUF883 family membrane-anchored ribosome-binding protein
MNTEGTAEERTKDSLNFDAHEFDGLREAFAEEAEGLLATANEMIRRHPWLCAGVALAAGVALGVGLRAAMRSCCTNEDQAEVSSDAPCCG